MQARMDRTFGDLSAVKSYTPPVREQAPAGAGPCTGPVTRAVSAASPAPSAAGPMQAKKESDTEYGERLWEEKAAKPNDVMLPLMDLPDDDPDNPGPCPWEITEKQLQDNHFNPTGSKTLAMMQASIDQAEAPDAAYNMFANMVGSADSGLLAKSGRAWNPTEVDPDKFKAKLKNMLRMYHDYPELEKQIGDMQQVTERNVSMNTSGTFGKRVKARIGYNPTTGSREAASSLPLNGFLPGIKIRMTTADSARRRRSTTETTSWAMCSIL